MKPLYKFKPTDYESYFESVTYKNTDNLFIGTAFDHLIIHLKSIQILL